MALDGIVQSADQVVQVVGRADRRRWKRVRINWSLLVYRGDEARPVATRTENMSSGGLYFFSALPFQEGERLHCLATIPTQGSPSENHQFLACDVRVVRTETAPQLGFIGVGCLIEDHWLQSTNRRSFRAANT